jgi:hypothetical protein
MKFFVADIQRSGGRVLVVVDEELCDMIDDVERKNGMLLYTTKGLG